MFIRDHLKTSNILILWILASFAVNEIITIASRYDHHDGELMEPDVPFNLRRLRRLKEIDAHEYRERHPRYPYIKDDDGYRHNQHDLTHPHNGPLQLQSLRTPAIKEDREEEPVRLDRFRYRRSRWNRPGLMGRRFPYHPFKTYDEPRKPEPLLNSLVSREELTKSYRIPNTRSLNGDRARKSLESPTKDHPKERSNIDFERSNNKKSRLEISPPEISNGAVVRHVNNPEVVNKPEMRPVHLRVPEEKRNMPSSREENRPPESLPKPLAQNLQSAGQSPILKHQDPNRNNDIERHPNINRPHWDRSRHQEVRPINEFPNNDQHHAPPYPIPRPHSKHPDLHRPHDDVPRSHPANSVEDINRNKPLIRDPADNEYPHHEFLIPPNLSEGRSRRPPNDFVNFASGDPNNKLLNTNHINNKIHPEHNGLPIGESDHSPPLNRDEIHPDLLSHGSQPPMGQEEWQKKHKSPFPIEDPSMMPLHHRFESPEYAAPDPFDWSVPNHEKHTRHLDHIPSYMDGLPHFHDDSKPKLLSAVKAETEIKKSDSSSSTVKSKDDKKNSKQEKKADKTTILESVAIPFNINMDDSSVNGCPKQSCDVKCEGNLYKLNNSTGCPTCECCPNIKCSIKCEKGYEADSNGCPLCKCIT